MYFYIMCSFEIPYSVSPSRSDARAVPRAGHAARSVRRWWRLRADPYRGDSNPRLTVEQTRIHNITPCSKRCGRCTPRWPYCAIRPGIPAGNRSPQSVPV